MKSADAPFGMSMKAASINGSQLSIMLSLAARWRFISLTVCLMIRSFLPLIR